MPRKAKANKTRDIPKKPQVKEDVAFDLEMDEPPADSDIAASLKSASNEVPAEDVVVLGPNEVDAFYQKLAWWNGCSILFRDVDYEHNSHLFHIDIGFKADVAYDEFMVVLPVGDDSMLRPLYNLMRTSIRDRDGNAAKFDFAGVRRILDRKAGKMFYVLPLSSETKSQIQGNLSFLVMLANLRRRFGLNGRGVYRHEGPEQVRIPNKELAGQLASLLG